MPDARDLLSALLEPRNLDSAEAEAFMEGMLESFDDAQVAGLLIAMRAKQATGSELAAMASVLHRHMADHSYDGDLVDTCGTGGGAPSFNMSTAAALVVAACGVTVAKHGNRAVTSTCGSADVLEHLGVKLDGDPEVGLHQHGIAILFAPHYHPALKRVGPVRRSLGVRTVFNQLGPLVNPLGAKRQLVGVYDDRLLRPMAEALLLLGAERAWVVHSEDGLDEISPCAPTRVASCIGGSIEEFALDPASLIGELLPSSTLTPGETIEESASILVEAISEPTSLRARALIPNVAATLWLAGAAETLESGAAKGLEAIASGAARTLLDRLRGAA